MVASGVAQSTRTQADVKKEYADAQNYFGVTRRATGPRSKLDLYSRSDEVGREHSPVSHAGCSGSGQ